MGRSKVEVDGDGKTSVRVKFSLSALPSVLGTCVMLVP